MSDYEVTYGENNWLSEILEAEDELYKDDIAYEWSNGRKMYSTDRYNSGVYDGT